MFSDNTPKGRYRLAAAVSITWILFFYFLSEPSDQWRMVLLFGILPVIAGWLILWIRRGYRQDQQQKKKWRWPWKY